MNEDALLNDYAQLAPEEQIAMHQKVIDAEQEHIDRYNLFTKLSATKEWKEFVEKWLLQDELIRIAKLTGTIVPSDKVAKANIKAVKDQLLMLSLLNEKLMSVKQRSDMARQSIASNKAAIDEIYNTSTGEDQEEEQ